MEEVRKASGGRHRMKNEPAPLLNGDRPTTSISTISLHNLISSHRQPTSPKGPKLSILESSEAAIAFAGGPDDRPRAKTEEGGVMGAGVSGQYSP